MGWKKVGNPSRFMTKQVQEYRPEGEESYQSAKFTKKYERNEANQNKRNVYKPTSNTDKGYGREDISAGYR